MPGTTKGAGWDGGEYAPFDTPRRAVLSINGQYHDVLVTRYRRGRWQITLPEGAKMIVTATHGQRRFMLRPGKLVTVPKDMIEFVDPLPEGRADP